MVVIMADNIPRMADMMPNIKPTIAIPFDSSVPIPIALKIIASPDPGITVPTTGMSKRRLIIVATINAGNAIMPIIKPAIPNEFLPIKFHKLINL